MFTASCGKPQLVTFSSDESITMYTPNWHSQKAQGKLSTFSLAGVI